MQKLQVHFHKRIFFMKNFLLRKTVWLNFIMFHEYLQIFKCTIHQAEVSHYDRICWTVAIFTTFSVNNINDSLVQK